MSAHRWIEQPTMPRLGLTAPIAVALHALVLVCLATGPPPKEPIPLDSAPDTPIAIELDTPPEAPPPPEPVEPEETLAPARPAPRHKPPTPAVAARAPASAPLSGAAESGIEGASNATGSDAAPAGSIGIEASQAAGGSAIAPAAPPDALPPPLLPRAIRAPRDVLEGPLTAKNTSTGLTASGQVMGTVQRVVRGEGAPRNGHGIVRILVDEDGTVSGVTTTSPSWAAVAKAIQAALAGRRFRVPKGAHGVLISFSVDAIVTRTPAVLTGEAAAEPMAESGVPAGSSPSDKPPTMAVIDPRALLPIPRHVVKVELLREEPR